jgi:Ni,Fe-hydrogenase III component G
MSDPTRRPQPSATPMSSAAASAAPAGAVVRVCRRQRQVSAADLRTQAGALLRDGFRLALVSAQEDLDAFRVVYLFTAGAPDRRVELVLSTERDTPAIPSLASLSFPAGRFEREMRDLYGIVPLHHPQPRRLVRHQHWPRG